MEGDAPRSAGPQHGGHVHRVVLPSGKTIEVVCFDERGIDAAPDHEELHVCGSCASQLVYPIDWEEAGRAHWQVTLRCPNCEWIGSGVFAQGAVERFDEELDRGTHALVCDLKRMVRANMEEQTERFIAALHAGLIIPEDF